MIKEHKNTSVEPNQEPELLINKIKGKWNAEQAIVVTTNGFTSVNATIATFENINGIWKQGTTFTGNIGKNGFTYNKVEGDGHSPIGIYTLGAAFGRYSNPGTSMDYRQSTPNDFWVDDVNSLLYNTWQEGPENGRWNSAENMYISPYNYAFVINYNTVKRMPGKGSAIFFHVWSGAGHGTEGCTATDQDNVISILKWLDPSKNPVIIEGPMSEVVNM
jgi:L,D-peptidoglycan transpeptidase YkuD (ErfK/YbiS/YcfS/YnhG family)